MTALRKHPKSDYSEALKRGKEIWRYLHLDYHPNHILLAIFLKISSKTEVI